MSKVINVSDVSAGLYKPFLCVSSPSCSPLLLSLTFLPKPDVLKACVSQKEPQNFSTRHSIYNGIFYLQE